MPAPAPAGVIAGTLLQATGATGGQVATAVGGAAAAGIAVAVWLTHPEGQPWDPVEVAGLGAGIGAGVGYAVKWLEIIRRWCERKLAPAEAPPAA